MPVNLEDLLTLLPPATAPLLGAAPSLPTAMRLEDAGDTRAWQMTLSRERGISAPICVILMPVPLDQGPQIPQVLPANTVYTRWHESDGSNTQRLRLPSRLWNNSQGLLVLFLHLHDNRLLDGIGTPWSQVTDLHPIADLRSKAIWEDLHLTVSPVPSQEEFQSVLIRKLLNKLASAQREPLPNMVRPPNAQAPGDGQARRPPGDIAAGATPQLTFIAASCAYQGGFLDRALSSPTWAAGPADTSMQRLIKWRQDSNKPQPTLALLLGDQIYADATAGLFDPRSLDNRYVQPYLDAQASRFLSEALSGIEIHTMIDDHEIDNNYSPITDRDDKRYEQNQERFAEGLAAYSKYQCFSAPGNLPPAFDADVRQNENLLDDYFEKNGIPFLVLDTRTHRSGRDALTIDRARLIKDVQWTAIKTMLKQSSPDRPVFICTPSILLPRRLSTDENAIASSLFSDAWDGYPAEFYKLLIMLHQEQANNVVFISGDEHLSCVAHFTVSCESEPAPLPPVSSCSIHSSPLYAPYPFANGMQEQLREQDDFTFCDPHDGTKTYRCITETTFAPAGDGFAVLQLRMEDPAQNPGRTRHWFLDVTFSRSSGDLQIQL